VPLLIVLWVAMFHSLDEKEIRFEAGAGLRACTEAEAASGTRGTETTWGRVGTRVSTGGRTGAISAGMIGGGLNDGS
jgi:hypothetical protein